MRDHQRRMLAEVPVREPLHQFVTLRVKATGCSGLRHAIAQLPVAQVVIGRDRDLPWRRQDSLRWITPVHIAWCTSKSRRRRGG